jgi:hypothetical protein
VCGMFIRVGYIQGLQYYINGHHLEPMRNLEDGLYEFKVI